MESFEHPPWTLPPSSRPSRKSGAARATRPPRRSAAAVVRVAVALLALVLVARPVAARAESDPTPLGVVALWESVHMGNADGTHGVGLVNDGAPDGTGAGTRPSVAMPRVGDTLHASFDPSRNVTYWVNAYADPAADPARAALSDFAVVAYEPGTTETHLTADERADLAANAVYTWRYVVENDDGSVSTPAVERDGEVARGTTLELLPADTGRRIFCEVTIVDPNGGVTCEGSVTSEVARPVGVELEALWTGVHMRDADRAHGVALRCADADVDPTAEGEHPLSTDTIVASYDETGDQVAFWYDPRDDQGELANAEADAAPLLSDERIEPYYAWYRVALDGEGNQVGQPEPIMTSDGEGGQVAYAGVGEDYASYLPTRADLGCGIVVTVRDAAYVAAQAEAERTGAEVAYDDVADFPIGSIASGVTQPIVAGWRLHFDDNDADVRVGTTDAYYLSGVNTFWAGAGHSADSLLADGGTRIEVPQRTGYIFAGYYLSEDDAGNGAGVRCVRADGTLVSDTGTADDGVEEQAACELDPGADADTTELHACWIAKDGYAVAYDTGTDEVATPPTARDLTWESVGLAPRVTRVGWGFGGWWTAPDGEGGMMVTAETPYGMVAAALDSGDEVPAEPPTLYARWVRYQYGVLVDLGGGLGTELIAVGADQPLDEAAAAAGVARARRRLSGWMPVSSDVVLAPATTLAEALSLA